MFLELTPVYMYIVSPSPGSELTTGHSCKHRLSETFSVHSSFFLFYLFFAPISFTYLQILAPFSGSLLIFFYLFSSSISFISLKKFSPFSSSLFIFFFCLFLCSNFIHFSKKFCLCSSMDSSRFPLLKALVVYNNDFHPG